jgi:hypothetical protein
MLRSRVALAFYRKPPKVSLADFSVDLPAIDAFNRVVV